MTDSATPIVLAVDIEPDGRAGAPGSGVPVDGVRATVRWLEGLRPRLAEATGRPVRYAWFLRMDPQIEWLAGTPDGLARAVEPELDRLLAAGDTVGLHTHAPRWDGTRWLADHGNPAWIRTCVESSVNAYLRFFGVPCREHRFGDRWSGSLLFEALVEAGIRVDLTLEPGQPPAPRGDPSTAATGSLPDYRRTPREAMPWGDGRLWLVPLTSADPGPGLPALRRVIRQARYLGQPTHRTHLLARPWISEAAFWDIAERRLAEMAHPYLAFAVRSDMTTGQRGPALRAVLERLLTRPIARQLRFTDGRGVLEAGSIEAPATAR